MEYTEDGEDEDEDVSTGANFLIAIVSSDTDGVLSEEMAPAGFPVCQGLCTRLSLAGLFGKVDADAGGVTVVELDLPPASTANVVKKQFEDVSREYYAWEQTYCSEKIASLCVSIPVVASITDFNVHLDASRETHPETSSVSTAGQQALFARYIVHDNGTSGADLVHADVINIIATPPTPYPSYESCTPTSRNILHGDDPPAMPFLPFADDSSFDPTDYVLDHSRLAWQEGYRDTDSRWRPCNSRSRHVTHGSTQC